MSVIVVLIGFSLLVAAGFLAAFFWAVKSGQYNDTYTPSVRILFDGTSPVEEKKKEEKIKPREGLSAVSQVQVKESFEIVIIHKE